MIIAERLELAYGTQTAVAGADFRVPGAAVTALIGSNGSGKSTLMNAVTGLIPVLHGNLEVLGWPAPPERGRVAYVLQRTEANELLPVTVRQVVAMGRFARRGFVGRFRAEDRRAVAAAMEQLEVSDLAENSLSELSGGQRQRVLVAQGLAQQADVLLLDEPFSGLDLVSRRRILDVAFREKEAGRTVVISTHDLEDARLADHVILLAGRVVAEGRPGEVLTPELLREAYGPRLVQVTEHGVVLDDRHAHGHP